MRLPGRRPQLTPPMNPRLAWLADSEYADSYSAREARVLLRALARSGEVVPLWFAIGSAEPPHVWDGIRVFPVPAETLGSPDFLQTLMRQQRPDLILSNVSRSAFAAGFAHLAGNGVPWIERTSPGDAPASGPSVASVVLHGARPVELNPSRTFAMPYLRGLDPAVRDGDEPGAVLERLRQIIAGAVASKAPPAHENLASIAANAPHVVMRQQLFCNSSLAHVMFELTNALIELRVPTVPQEEHAILSRGYIHREDALFRLGAPEKYARIAACVDRDYDPETAITVHFCMFKTGASFSRFGTFHSLAPREVLYTTGNHTVRRDGLRQITDAFEKILAPSEHVLQPYLEAGLTPARGAVIPHGIDPAVFAPEAAPMAYPTEKTFKFLQTSFPWVNEKGFDLSVQAFCRAFTARDDAALILRTPRIRDPEERNQTFGRLQALVKRETARPGAPEVVLLEQDVELNRRGGIYTGADCYVFPLRAEGFGMTILEAMACGLPVIATPWSGPADFLSPRYAYTLRHSGLIAERTRDGTLLRHHVEPDLEHLVHLMRFVYEHREEARALGALAAKVAREQWTWKHAAAKLASVLGVPPTPAPVVAVP